MRKRFRLPGAIWMLGALTGLVVFTMRGLDTFSRPEFLWQGVRDAGFWGSMMPLFFYFTISAVGGWGLMRHKNWGRLTILSVAPFLLIYCVLFLMTVWTGYGAFTFALAWAFGLFAVYCVLTLLFRWENKG
jgi:O-antigen/teichoic acid export membrane protein